MKAVAFVPVRLTSSRLPEKHLKSIGDKPLISWVIKRLKDCKEIDSIVICAPEEPESEKLEDICKKEGVNLFIYEGDVNDVVGRLTKASKVYNADICILASGDCPLLSSESIDRLVGVLKKEPEYYRAVFKNKGGRVPIHEGIIVARREVWELADKLSSTPKLREHQFPVIGLYPEKFSHFKVVQLEDEDIYYALNHRISVDTPSDLEFMNRVYSELKNKGQEFNLKNVLLLLQENPEYRNINKNVKRKGLNEPSYTVLFVVSAVSKFGYGNLIRSLEIASDLVDSGVGARFAVFDDSAKLLCESKHFKADVIDDLSDILALKTLKKSNLIVFDLNNRIKLPVDLISKVRDLQKRVVVIDNISFPTELVDLIIIPTAHYTGKEFPNLLTGPEYVVIRKKVLTLKSRKFDRRGVIVRVDSKFKPTVKQIWQDVNFVDYFTDDFHIKLASSEIAVLHLGISCYEAVFLGTPTVIIPRDEKEISEISKFYSFLIQDEVTKLGGGSKNIAEKLRELLSERY